MLFASEDGMKIGYTCAGSSPVIGIVADREEAHTLCQISFLSNFTVEVMQDGNIEAEAARIDPVFAELIPVTAVDWLNCITKSVEDSSEGLERPTITAKRFPELAIILERSK